jgi:hypothetical protein
LSTWLSKRQTKLILIFSVFVQVLDYYIFMKVNDGTQMFEQLFVLLHLQMMLNPRAGDRTYIRCTILQLLILLYQQRQDLPAWQMLARDASMFNEETGEMSFSILSRCVQEEQMASKHAHLDNMYRMVPYIMSLEDDVHQDTFGGRNGPQFNWRREATLESETCQSILAYLKKACRDTGLNTRRQYDGKNKDSTCYKNQETGDKHWIGLVRQVPFWDADVPKILAGDLLSTRQYTYTNFGCNHVHIWPEMKYQIPGHHLIGALPVAADAAGEGKGGDDDGGDDDQDDDPDAPAAAAVAQAVLLAVDGAGPMLEEEEEDDEGNHTPADNFDDEHEGDEGEEGDEGDEGDDYSEDSSHSEAEYEDQDLGGKGDSGFHLSSKSSKRQRTNNAYTFRSERKGKGNKGYDSNFYY